MSSVDHHELCAMADAIRKGQTSDTLLVNSDIFVKLLDIYHAQSDDRNLVTALNELVSDLNLEPAHAAKLLDQHTKDRIQRDAHQLNLLKDRPRTKRLT